MSLELLNPRNAADVDSVATLHETYLPDSPVAKLGKRFLRSFYYKRLLESGLFGCSLCRVDGRVVGFISYTSRPQDFMSLGLRRFFLPLAWLMFGSILERPVLLKDILLTLRMTRMRSREAQQVDPRGLGGMAP